MDNPDDGSPRKSADPKGHRPFLLGVLFLSFYLSYLILAPFLHILVLSIVLASLFTPLQLRLTRAYGGRKNLAALTVVLIITFALALPVFLFVSALVGQGIGVIEQINAWLRAGGVQQLIDNSRVESHILWLQGKLPFLPAQQLEISDHLLTLSRSVGQYVLGKGAVILGDIAALVSHFFMMIFITFYLVRDGGAMLDALRYYSPLRREQEDHIVDGVRMVTRSVLVGSLVTALCQGLVGGVGLAIAGIPGVFWGTVMGFTSLIPVIGTGLVWVPASIYLVLVGQWKYGLFLTVWSVLLVGSIDNFLRPFLMGGEGRLPPFYIFLAIIGGVQYFGLVGVLYGPLILSLAMIMLYIYGVEYSATLESEGKSVPPEAGGPGTEGTPTTQQSAQAGPSSN